jgi:hypothetical protein
LEVIFRLLLLTFFFLLFGGFLVLSFHLSSLPLLFDYFHRLRSYRYLEIQDILIHSESLLLAFLIRCQNNDMVRSSTHLQHLEHLEHLRVDHLRNIKILVVSSPQDVVVSSAPTVELIRLFEESIAVVTSGVDRGTGLVVTEGLQELGLVEIRDLVHVWLFFFFGLGSWLSFNWRRSSCLFRLFLLLIFFLVLSRLLRLRGFVAVGFNLAADLVLWTLLLSKDLIFLFSLTFTFNRINRLIFLRSLFTDFSRFYNFLYFTSSSSCLLLVSLLLLLFHCLHKLLILLLSHLLPEFPEEVPLAYLSLIISAPHIDLTLGGEGDRMVLSTCYLNETVLCALVRGEGLDLGGFVGVFVGADAELAVVVLAPGKNLVFLVHVKAGVFPAKYVDGRSAA